MICDWKSFMLNTTYKNTVFLSEWSIYEIVCLTGLFLLTPLTHLKRDWINSGTIKILFMISEHSYREREVGVKFCMNNFSKLVYCRMFIWCGYRGFRPVPVNSVYVYVYVCGHWPTDRHNKDVGGRWRWARSNSVHSTLVVCTVSGTQSVTTLHCTARNKSLQNQSHCDFSKSNCAAIKMADVRDKKHTFETTRADFMKNQNGFYTRRKRQKNINRFSL